MTVKRPRRDTVTAECCGGPRDGETWVAFCYGEPMFPDHRLAGYVYHPNRAVLEWSPENPRAFKRGTP